jgi:D-aminopeptidase
VSRVNARTVGFQSDDYVKGFKMLRALIALAPPR